MKKSWLFLVLAVSLSSYAWAQMPSATEKKQTELFSTAHSLLKSRSCFGGPFQSYDSFIEFRKNIGKNQPRFSEAKLTAEYSRADFERYQRQLDCQDFVYKVGDVPVRGFMIKPKTLHNKTPVIIYNRGGNADYGQLTFGFVMQKLMPVAEHGFVIIASNYRGQHNWGKKTVINAGSDEFGGADLADVTALVPIVKGIKDADANRMAMWGHSRGGMMTYMLAKTMPELKTIVVGAGPTDFAKELEIRPAMENVYKVRIPNYSSNKAAALAERSVLLWPEMLPANLPILIQHGDQDKHVPVSSSEQLALKLQALKHPHKLLIYPGADHGFNPVRAKAQQDMLNWLKRYLG